MTVTTTALQPSASSFFDGDAPDVIVLAEDHPSPGEAGASDVGQRGAATRTLEASGVPVAVHRVQQEAVTDLAATSAATAHQTSVVRHSDHRRAATSASGTVARGSSDRRPAATAARSRIGRRRSTAVRHARVHDRPVTVPSESVGRVVVHARSSASPLLLNPDGGAASVQLAALGGVAPKKRR